MATQTTRRDFLKRSAATAGGGWVLWSTPAILATMDLACANQAAGTGFQALSDRHAVELEELTALIIPSDDTPGAREAGVVWYIDAAVAQSDLEDRRQFESELDAMLMLLSGAYDGRASLLDLTMEERLEFATSIQDNELFRDVRDATITGMFAHPKHGGNRDKLGWQLLGFDDRHTWQPPFGHYDAPYHANDSSGA